MVRYTGTQVKIARRILGLDQYELAHLIDSHQATISKAEREKGNEYIAHGLNKKLVEGLQKHEIDPIVLHDLVTLYIERIKEKLENIKGVGK